MSTIYKGYEAGKQIFGALKKAFTGGKQKTTGTEVIKSVAPNVPKTKKEKLLTELKKTTQTVKGATAKLKQTQFERANPQFKGHSFTFATNTKKTPSNTELKDQADYLNKIGKYKPKKNK